jgi:hypothetical protein
MKNCRVFKLYSPPNIYSFHKKESIFNEKSSFFFLFFEFYSFVFLYVFLRSPISQPVIIAVNTAVPYAFIHYPLRPSSQPSNDGKLLVITHHLLFVLVTHFLARKLSKLNSRRHYALCAIDNWGLDAVCCQVCFSCNPNIYSFSLNNSVFSWDTPSKNGTEVLFIYISSSPILFALPSCITPVYIDPF